MTEGPTFAEMMAAMDDPKQEHWCSNCDEKFVGPKKGATDDTGEDWYCNGCWATFDEVEEACFD